AARRSGPRCCFPGSTPAPRISWVAYLLKRGLWAAPGAVADHPADAVAVGDHAETAGPEGFGKGHGDLATLLQLVEHLGGPVLIIVFQVDAGSLGDLLAFACHVRTHQPPAADVERAVDDQVGCLRRYLCGSRSLAVGDQGFQGAADGLVIEGHGLAAGAGKTEMDIDLHRHLQLLLVCLHQRTGGEIPRFEIAPQFQYRVAVTVQRRPLPGPFDGLFEAVELQDGVARELFAGRREGPAHNLRLTVAEHDAAAFAGRPQTVAEQEYPGLDHAVVVVEHGLEQLVGRQDAVFGFTVGLAHQHEFHPSASSSWRVVTVGRAAGRGIDSGARQHLFTPTNGRPAPPDVRAGAPEIAAPVPGWPGSVRAGRPAGLRRYRRCGAAGRPGRRDTGES